MIWKIFLENHNVTGLLTISQDIENIMNVYMNICLLLYADDTVLMAETPEDLPFLSIINLNN
jgi:hypothetical protein